MAKEVYDGAVFYVEDAFEHLLREHKKSGFWQRFSSFDGYVEIRNHYS